MIANYTQASSIASFSLLWLLFFGTALTNAAETPGFTLTEKDREWWLVSPQGERFFSAGVCMVTPGLTREKWDPENPGYAAWQHYPNDAAWADATLNRLRSWGFTTIGGWSAHKHLLKSSNMVRGLTPVLHVGSTAGAPWWDMWDEKIIARMDSVAREQILAVRDDPRLIGYYSDNEMGWWNATLFHMALEQPATSGQRQKLVQMLRDTYGNDWDKLLADFEPELADNWDGLEKRGQLWVKPGGDGVKVMRRFLSLVATRYYQLVHQIIRNYDQRGLILGDRYQSFFYPEVARAAAPYVDAISSNLNASWNDGTFLRFYLETLHQLTGKPVFVSEIYMSATQNRSGNRNSHGVFPVVESQKDRASALKTTLLSLAHTPYVVGADWFQYFDEPRHGREDGENFNFGLVDIHNEPYTEITSLFAKGNLTELKTRSTTTPADVSSGVPRAPRDPFASFVPTQALRHWNRERGFVKPLSELPLADLYLCWSPQALYLGLYSFDIIEEGYYRNKSVPKNDRPLWTVQITSNKAETEQKEPISARIGAGRQAIVNDPEVRVENLSGLQLNVRNIAIMEVPAQRLGRKRLRSGDSVQLQSTLVSHGRVYRAEWKETLILR